MEYLAHSTKGEIQEQPYQKHVSEVLQMAEDIAKRVSAYTKYGTLLLSAVKYAASFHDLGKLDPENQRVLKNSRGRLPINHVDGGVAWLLSQPSLLRNLAALSVYAHHIGLPSLPTEAAKGTGKVFRDETLKGVTDKRLQEYLDIHESLLGLPDASYIQWKGLNPSSLCMRVALSCLVDADHTDTARNYNNVVPEGEIPLQPEKRLVLLDRYVEGLSSENLDKQERSDLRRQVYGACRQAKPANLGIIACDSPVGTGKTTAVMAHLLNVARMKGLRRVFVVLPFTNIIDQSVEVYRKALVSEGELAEKVVAAHHHKAEFEDLETRAFSFLWNAPITVTTAVQFFETLASNHPATLRKLHQLAGSAIFIDEAHAALPAHLWPQAWKWLNELVRDWGCYIVMASGSLTRFWELEEFSLPPAGLEELVKKDVREKAFEAETSRINYKKKDDVLGLDELCRWITGLPGPRLVILNTVQSTAAVAKHLAGNDYCCRNKVEHLSTALAPVHRNQTVKKIKARLANKGDTDWTLVATSCVEAGVNFSFRTAARESCSLVSTIQTAGRINRSGEFQESDLWNFKIVPGDFLREHRGFRVSATILDEMYKEGKVSPEFCKDAMKREVRQNNQGSCEEDPIVRAERNKDFPDVEKQFKVIAQNTVTVVIDPDLRQRIESGDKVSPSELQQKSINIYSSRIDQLALKPLVGFPGLYAWTLAYDDFIGYMVDVLKMINFSDNCCI